MSKFGGGGTKCFICEKTAYPAETVSFEKHSYHVNCFKCSLCDVKMEGPAKASMYEEKLFCRKCFSSEGYAQKQASTGWKPKESKGSAVASKFGGGGQKCTICDKTVYAAETVSYEKKPYHASCFKCSTCGKKMTPSNAAKFEDSLHCTKCFQEGGFARKQAASGGSGTKSTTSNAMSSRFGGGGTKCYVCEKTVYSAEAIQYEKKTFHASCFKCKHCSTKLSPSGAEGKKDGDDIEVYCRKCWGELGLNRAKVVQS